MKFFSVFFKAIVVFIKKYLSLALLLIGLLFIFASSFYGMHLEAFIKGSTEFILSAGSAILGAGVFAVIMKSHQFTEVFQKHIYDVFYKPELINIGVPLVSKWELITNSLLSEVLPQAHNDATSLIKEQFFNAELEYHFEDYCIIYDIEIEPGTDIATVTTTTLTNIIIAPNVESPKFKQAVDLDENMEVLDFRLNDTKITIDCNETKSSDYKKRFEFFTDLTKFMSKSNKDVDQVIKMERTIKITQNLSVDPLFYATIGRYIKGAKVMVKVSPDYTVQFKKTGLGPLPENHYTLEDGKGYQRWQLVSPNNLLLPGQGYIILLTKFKEDK